MTGFLCNFPWDEIGIQMIGFIAMALDCFSFQAKKRKWILLIQIAACVFWILQMLLLGGYTGAAMNLLAIGRAVVFMLKDKYQWAQSKWTLFITISAFIGAAMMTYENLLSLLPMGAMIVLTVALYLSDERKIRVIALLSVPLWFVYDFNIGSYAGIASEIMNFSSILIAMARYRKNNKP